jgi:hypothetical protein
MIPTWVPFQSKWLQIYPINITFLADSVPFKEKCISPNIQIQMPWNLVEMFITKSSSSCKNLSFIWHLNCYQILILPLLLHAKNCCTIAYKMYSKTEASLIQFLWKLYSILYHKSRACIPNFKWIQIDLITQTWLRSQLAQIFNIGHIWAMKLYFIKCESNLNQLVWILSQDIYPFNPLTKDHLMNLSNTNQPKLDY